MSDFRVTVYNFSRPRGTYDTVILYDRTNDKRFGFGCWNFDNVIKKGMTSFLSFDEEKRQQRYVDSIKQRKMVGGYDYSDFEVHEVYVTSLTNLANSLHDIVPSLKKMYVSEVLQYLNSWGQSIDLSYESPSNPTKEKKSINNAFEMAAYAGYGEW
jgi:hypothetical protein